MAKNTENIEKLSEKEIDSISLKLAQQLHEGIPEVFQGDVKEMAIARCVKSILSEEGQIERMASDALEDAATELREEGSVNPRFTGFKPRFLGTKSFDAVPGAVVEYLDCFHGEDPLTSKVPFTLEQAVCCDIYSSIVLFYRDHHIEEDIQEVKGGK
jgi:hypothetical protein